MSLGKIVRIHIEQGFQQGVAIHKHEEQEAKADRDRTAKIAGNS
jgi:hypothetical protein